jgi:uncharacterized membrane protein
MIPLPEPLHPAIVHFPIALLLVGAAVAVAAVFVRRWHLPLFAAILLSLGALGAVAATVTGEKEEKKVEHALPSAEPVLEKHAEWGESARNAGILAAVFAIGAAALVSRPVIGRSLSVLTAFVAIGAGYAVAQAGHFGGELVYRHGAGVTLGSGGTGAAAPASPALEYRREVEHGDD